MKIALFCLGILVAVIFAKKADSKPLNAKYWKKRFTWIDQAPHEPLFTGSVPFGSQIIPSIDNIGEDIPTPSPNAVSVNFGLITRENSFHAFRTMTAAQVYTFIRGRPVDFYVINNSTGTMTKTTLGFRKDNLAISIPPDTIAALGWTSLRSSNSYSLIAASTFPYFKENDEAYVTKAELLRRFPQHRKIIKRFAIDIPSNMQSQ